MCRLKELLRTRLIECGWREQLKVQCKEVVREKGLENVTVDDLVTVITPKGRGQAGAPLGQVGSSQGVEVRRVLGRAQWSRSGRVVTPEG